MPNKIRHPVRDLDYLLLTCQLTATEKGEKLSTANMHWASTGHHFVLETSANCLPCPGHINLEAAEISSHSPGVLQQSV